MREQPHSIFICYRREDSAHVCGRLYDYLVSQFGRKAIFRDVDTIPPGKDFRDYIHERLQSARIGLVLIGPAWATIRDDAGALRLQNESDFVRIEVENLLRRKEVEVVPLLTGNFSLTASLELPDSLKDVVYRNGLPIRPDPDFRRDAERLVARIREIRSSQRDVERQSKRRDIEEPLPTFNPLSHSRNLLSVVISLVLLGCVLFSTLVADRDNWPWQSLDDRIVYWLSLVWHSRSPLPPVTLVRIDDDDLKDHRWDSLSFALFFSSVVQTEPAVVAAAEVVDPTMAGSDTTGKQEQYRRLLRDNLLRSSRVVLATQVGNYDNFQTGPKPVFNEISLQGDVSEIPRYTDVIRSPEEDLQLSATLGLTEVPSIHSTHNFIPLVVSYQGKLAPSFVLQCIMGWVGVGPEGVSGTVGESINAGPIRIPIDRQGRMRINFAVPVQSVSFGELLLAKEQNEAGHSNPIFDLRTLKGSIVILGRTDRDAQALKLVSGHHASKGALFASAIGTVQKNAFLRYVPVWLDILVALGVFALVVVIRTVTRVASVIVTSCVALSYLGTAVFVLNKYGTCLAMFLPTVAVLGAGLWRGKIRAPEPVEPIQVIEKG